MASAGLPPEMPADVAMLLVPRGGRHVSAARGAGYIRHLPVVPGSQVSASNRRRHQVKADTGAPPSASLSPLVNTTVAE